MVLVAEAQPLDARAHAGDGEGALAELAPKTVTIGSFSCAGKPLRDALALAARFSNASSSVPILRTALFEPTGFATVRITSTDLESRFQIDVPGSFTGQAFCCDPKQLGSMIDRVTGQVDVSCATRGVSTVTVTAAGATSKLYGFAAADFPRALWGEVRHAEVSVELLKDALSKAITCAATEEERGAILMGLFFRITQKRGLEIVATDGYRLSHSSIPVNGSEPCDVIVPRAMCANLLKALPKTGVVDICLTDNKSPAHIRFSFESDSGSVILVGARSVDGRYPDWKKVIPKKWDFEAKLDRAGLIVALMQASVFAEDRAHMAVLTLNGASQLNISAKSAFKGEVSLDLLCSQVGKPMRIAFNAKYMAQILKTSKTKDVKLEFSGPLSPTRISQPGDSSFAVLMPLRM